MTRGLIAKVLIFCGCFGATRLIAQVSGPDRGAQQFLKNCAGCHAADGTGSGKGAAIATLPGVIALSDADLVGIVRNGVPGKGMPEFPQLGDENIQAVVRYLRTLQGVAGTSTPAVKAEARAQGAKVLAPVEQGGPVAIDVQQSDLNQKETRENWVSYNGDYTGRRYSSLTEVTPQNVHSLVKKWAFHTQGAGVLQVTPVVVAGVMFVTRSNDAYAVDAKTGKQLWHYARNVSGGLIDDAAGHINRGVAVMGTRVYMETDNAHLLCLDARSGKMIWDVVYATGSKNYGATSAPLIVKIRCWLARPAAMTGYVVLWRLTMRRRGKKRGGSGRFLLPETRARRVGRAICICMAAERRGCRARTMRS